MRESVLLLALAALALLPGLAVAVIGRQLRRHAGDPSLPDRVLALRGNANAVTALAIAAAVLVARGHAWWIVPLQVLSALAGWFPTRKRLYEETWGLAAYLGHTLRTWLGFAGPWLMLALLPLLVRTVGGGAPWTAAALLLAVAMLWQITFAPALLALLHAQPLGRDDLEPRFRSVCERSRTVAPQVFRVAAHGGRWANAFALPHPRTPRVVLTATLLDTLDADELTAIFAHEVAHLEHYDHATLRIQTVVVTLAALAGAFVIPVLGPHAAEHGTLACWLWGMGVLAALVVRMVRHKEHEAESDQRAAELCGDPEALVRALTKLHTLALLPRRWTRENEEMASHPSLARRIQALRAPSGGASPALDQDLAVPTTSGAWIVFDAERVHWLEGVSHESPADPSALRAAAASARSFVYGELQELRLDFRKRPPRVRAEDRDGRSWTVPIRAEDAAAVQAAIQKVDVRLAPPARREHRVVASLVASLTTLVSVSSGTLALALPGLAAGIRPDPASLAAVGAGGLVHVLVVALTERHGGERIPVLVAVTVLSLLALLLARNTAWRITTGRVSGRIVTIVLAMAALLAWVPLALQMKMTAPATALRELAEAPSATFVLGASLAAALAFARAPGWRWVSLLPAAITATGLVAVTPAFSRYTADPNELPAGSPVVASGPSLAPSHERPLAGRMGRVRLSPSGASYATFAADDEAAIHRFRVWSRGVAAGEEIEAADLAFFDDDRVIVLRQAKDEQWSIALLDATGARLWAVVLPVRESPPQLAVRPRDDTWWVTRPEPEHGRLAVFSGRVGESTMTTAHVPLPAGVTATAFSSPSSALGVRLQWHGPTQNPWLMLLSYGRSVRFDSELWRLEPSGPRLVGHAPAMLQCEAPHAPGQPFVCLGRDMTGSSLWAIGPGDVSIRALGRLDSISVMASTPIGAAVAAGENSMLIDPNTGIATRLDVPKGLLVSQLVGYDNGVAAVVMDDHGASRLLLFSTTLNAK